MVTARKPAGSTGNDPATLLRKQILELAAIRDDLYNISLLNNPGMFAAGSASKVVRALSFVPATGTAVAQEAYQNVTDQPVVVFLRAIMDDQSEFALLFGPKQAKTITLSSAPGMIFTRGTTTAVVVQPNTTLFVSAFSTSPTGTCLVVVGTLALRGQTLVLGICADDYHVSEVGLNADGGASEPDEDDDDDEFDPDAEG